MVLFRLMPPWRAYIRPARLVLFIEKRAGSKADRTTSCQDS